MGYKSRGNFKSGICLRDCKNRDRKCDVCIKFNKFIANKEREDEIQLEK